MKKVAIVGAGFSGLGLCYHLLQRGVQVTVFDGKGIGGGASGIASGLLHPYPGERATLAWKGREGLASTKELLKVVGPHAYKATGILRLSVNEEREALLRKRASEEEDVEWWDEEACRRFLPGIHYLPGIFIHSGITVHPRAYLKGLWEVCETLGGHFEKRNVSLSELEGFDQVALAAGGGIRSFTAAKSLDLRFNKGQILVCKRPHYMNNESSIIGKGYVALSEKKDRCYLGSTYERDYVTQDPCLGTATTLIFKQVEQFLSTRAPFSVEGCLSEMRVTTKDYRPIVGEIEKGIYAITGMGSRGLLYHSYFGKILAEEMTA